MITRLALPAATLALACAAPLLAQTEFDPDFGGGAPATAPLGNDLETSGPLDRGGPDGSDLLRADDIDAEGLGGLELGLPVDTDRGAPAGVASPVPQGPEDVDLFEEERYPTDAVDDPAMIDMGDDFDGGLLDR